MNKFIVVSFFVALSLITNSSLVWAQGISKCQDADGKWHYGSGNSYRCADSSEITKISDNGVKISKEAPVQTKDQLEAKKKEKRVLDEKLKKERKDRIERGRILMVYQSEDDIERDRESKLKSLSQKKQQHEQYIFALKKQNESFDRRKSATNNFSIKKSIDFKKSVVSKKIEKSTKRIKSIDGEVTTLNEKFDDILVFFRSRNK